MNELTKAHEHALAEADGKTTCISNGSHVDGILHSAGDVRIMGRFHGEIQAKNSVFICFDAEASVTANTVHVIASNFKGDISASDAAEVNAVSTVEGNVNARIIIVAGTVIGDLEARDAVALHSGARIEGGIKARNLSVERGATINGILTIGL